MSQWIAPFGLSVNAYLTLLPRMSRSAKNVNERPTAFFLGGMLSVPDYSFKPVSTRELTSFAAEGPFRLRGGMTLARVVCNMLRARLPMVRRVLSP